MYIYALIYLKKDLECGDRHQKHNTQNRMNDILIREGFRMWRSPQHTKTQHTNKRRI